METTTTVVVVTNDNGNDGRHKNKKKGGAEWRRSSVLASSTTSQGSNSGYIGDSVVHATGSCSRPWWSEVAAAPAIEEVNGDGWREV